MYRFYVNKKNLGNILFIVIDPDEKPNWVVKKGNVVALYYKDKLIGYNLFSFLPLENVSVSGMIPVPSAELFAKANDELAKEGFEPLKPLGKTLYTVATIVSLEEHPLDEKAQIVTLSIGEKKYTTVSHYTNLKVGESVVVEEDGCLTLDGTRFHSFVARNINNDVSICGASELLLPNSIKGEAFIAKGMSEGSDYFLGGK